MARGQRTGVVFGGGLRIMNETTDRSPAGTSRGLNGRAQTVALIVAATMFMQMLDSTIITTSLPQIAQSLAVAPTALSIGVTIFMLAMAVVMPVSGWLADRIGSRTVFLLAIAIFVASSLWVGASRGLEEFVLARAAQGVGGALMTPVGRILVLRSAEKHQLLEAIALITWPALFAPVIGPVIGGFITTYFSWRWNFYINVPLGLIAAALVWAFIPDYREDRRRPLDLAGLALTAAASGCLLYGLETLAHGGLRWPVIGIFAVRHLRRSATPLIDLSAVGHQTFRYSNVSGGLLLRCAIAATPFLLPLFCQLVLGMSALEAGGYLLVYFLGNLAMKTVTTPIVRTFGFRTVLVTNGFLCAGFLATFVFFGHQTPQPLLVFALFGAGLTRSMQFTALNTLGFADIANAQKSAASVLSSVLQQFAMVLGVAFAAAALGLGQMLDGGPEGTGAFALAFGAIALLAMVGAAQFIALPLDAGAIVAGRRAENPAQ
jgi:EmrB/QacA subfamily drug resistance transporter